MYNIELFLLNTAQCKKLNILQKDCMLNFVNDIVDKNFFKLKDDKIESIFSSLIYNGSFDTEEKESIIKKYLEYKFKVFNHKKESGKEDLFNFSLFLNNVKTFCERNNYTESIEMINQIENKIKKFSIIDYTKLFKYNLDPNLLYTSEDFKTFVDNILTYLNNEYTKNHDPQILNIIDKFYLNRPRIPCLLNKV